jgi:hypothetical protein
MHGYTCLFHVGKFLHQLASMVHQDQDLGCAKFLTHDELPVLPIHPESACRCKHEPLRVETLKNMG